jgi:hypothetical protein
MTKNKEVIPEIVPEELNIRMIHLVTQAPFGVDNTPLTRLSDTTYSFKMLADFILVTKIAGGARCLLPMSNVGAIVLKD